MRHFKIQLAIVILGALVHGNSAALKWTSLKVTFGVNPLSNAFSSMPLTTTNAEASDWQSLSSSCTNDNNFYGFRYMYKNDPGITLLYDKNGIIAGIQMNLLKSEVVSSKNKYRYDKVKVYQSTTVKGQEVYTLTAYFVNPEIICTSGRTAADLESQGPGTSLYLQNGNTLPLNSSNVIRVPLKRSHAIREGWSKNNCFYGMGYHNFYKSEQFENSHCLEIRPFFLLYNGDDDLHGFGFAGIGTASSSRFEHPGESALKAIIGNDVAQCMVDIAKTPGISTLHVYFTNYPYLINCWF